jgi:hypothetical protein
MEEKKKKPGPKPKAVEIDGDWREAMKKALKKKRPKEGWPKDEKGS